MTAWHLAAPALPNEMKINAVGEGVSLRHSGLTKALCERTGAPNSLLGTAALASCLSPMMRLPSSRCIDALLCMFGRNGQGATVQINGVPAEEDALGNEVLIELASSFGLSITRRPSSML